MICESQIGPIKMTLLEDAPLKETPVKLIEMIRPEDRAGVIARVKPDEVAYWKSHGWAVKG